MDRFFSLQGSCLINFNGIFVKGNPKIVIFSINMPAISALNIRKGWGFMLMLMSQDTGVLREAFNVFQG